jgi:hypothetical protein
MLLVGPISVRKSKRLSHPVSHVQLRVTVSVNCYTRIFIYLIPFMLVY